MSTNTTSAERVLITGAAGFLGSHLCDRFVKDGYQVVAMDNLITGDMRTLGTFPSPNFTFVRKTSGYPSVGRCLAFRVARKPHRLPQDSNSDAGGGLGCIGV